MISADENRDKVRETLRGRLQGRGLPVGDTVFTGTGTEAKVTDFDTSMIKQIYLVTEQNCPGCHDAMEEFLDDIQDGTLRVVDVGDDKGFEIVQALGITAVPTLVIELTGGGYLEFRRS